MIEKSKAPAPLVASVLLGRMTELKRQGIDVDAIDSGALVKTFEEYAAGRITKAAIEEVLKSVPKTPKDVDKIIKNKGLERISGKDLEALVAKFKKESVKAVMSSYRLNVDGDELNSILKKMVG